MSGAAPAASPSRLSEWEHEVLRALGRDSLKTTEVAERLRTSDLNTVSTALENARARGYVGRSQSGAWYVR